MKKCVNCGKEYDPNEIEETWSINGKEFFCSEKCNFEWVDNTKPLYKNDNGGSLKLDNG